MTVNLDHRTLADGVAAATLADGSRLSASQARRLACRVGILPVVLDGESQPLDLGRSRRLFSRAQRLALARRDGGCTFPDCDRPPSWCEAHHLTRWGDGGRTDLADGALLCSRHHHHVHEVGWAGRVVDGHVEWRPPEGGRWRRHRRWRC